jgi:WD40 repeat protein
VETGELLMTLGLHARGVEHVSVAPNNAFFVTAAPWDNTMRMWCMETGRCIKKFEHKSKVKSLTISPDSKYIMTGYDDSNIRIWSVLRGNVTCTLSGHRSSVTSVALSSDATFAVSTSYLVRERGELVGDSALIWSMGTGKVRRVLHDGQEAWTQMVLSPDDKFVVTGYWHAHVVKIWSVATGALVKSYENIACASLAYSSDGKILAMGDTNGNVYLVSSRTGKFIKTMQIYHRYNHVKGVAFSPNKYVLATAGYGKEAKVWDIFKEERKAVEALLDALVSPRSKAHAFVKGDGDNAVMKRVWTLLVGVL